MCGVAVGFPCVFSLSLKKRGKEKEDATCQTEQEQAGQEPGSGRDGGLPYLYHLSLSSPLLLLLPFFGLCLEASQASLPHCP